MCDTTSYDSSTSWQGHIIIANTLETVPFPWLSENINSKIWIDKKRQESPQCNNSDNKYKCYEGIK